MLRSADRRVRPSLFAAFAVLSRTRLSALLSALLTTLSVWK